MMNEDTGWCWFQGERAIIDGDQLLFTGVSSTGTITVSAYDMKAGEGKTVVMNDTTFKSDDHNAGALLLRPDGKYLTVYAGHGNDSLMRYRVSTKPHDIDQWELEKQVETGSNTTYSNVYRLSSTGTTYNFHRGIEWDPNYMISEDNGDTWHYGGRLFAFKGRPYLRYTSNNMNRIDFITTEEHPRNYNNSIYHGYIQGGYVYQSNGQRQGVLSKTENTDLSPQDFTVIFQTDTNIRANIAWTSDIKLDKNGYPYVAFSVTKDPIKLRETKNTNEGGFDHRYHYARWDGKQWNEHEIAFAGTRLYAGENEYTGLITLHPNDPNIVYISTNVDPTTGKPLTLSGNQYHEIFRGNTSDQGATWKWVAITKDSKEDNIRPMIVANEHYEALLWLKGKYTAYTKYNLKAMGLIQKK